MKKIISLITILSLIFTVSVLSLSASAETNDILDVSALSDSDTSYALGLINAVCPEVTIGDSGYYTRGEFVSTVVRLLNLTSSAPTEQTFSDVPLTHPYAAEIDSGAKLGFISSADTFYPDSPITFSQALKIVTVAIGYGERAEQKGGYPVGYLKIAKDNDIGVGFDFSSDEPLSYEDGAVILRDMLCADILDIVSYGDELEYGVTKGKNILSAYHGIYMIEGIVEANQYTALTSSENNCGGEFVRINGIEFSGSGFDDYIGQNVRVFYKDSFRRNIVYLYPKDNKYLTYDDEYDLDISGTVLKVDHKDYSKVKTYSLSNDYSVIYNGKFISSSDYNEIINPESGSVKFIDNNDDNKYDVINVESFDYGYITRIDASGKKIYDKYKKVGMLDLSDPNCKYYIYGADGQELSLDNVTIDDSPVAKYVISKDRLYVKINLLNRTGGGVLTEKLDGEKFVIGDKTYTLSKYFTENILKYEDIKLGNNVDVYLGQKDEIVSMQISAADNSYAFVIDIGSVGTLDSDIFLKLMVPSKGVVVYPLAQRVTYNGTSKSRSSVSDEIEALITKEDQYRVIKFTLNEEGYISSILTAEDSIDSSDIFKMETPQTKPKFFFAGNCYVRSGSLTPYLFPGSRTNYIMIPTSEEDKKIDDKYKTMTFNSLAIDTTYSVLAYDIDEGGVAGLLIVYESSDIAEINESTSSFLLERAFETVNEEGDICMCLKGYEGGAYKMLYTGADSPDTVYDEFNLVKPGDILRVAYDSENIIKKIVVDYSYLDRINNCNEHNHASGYVHFITGPIYSISGSTAIIAPDNADLSVPLSYSDATVVNFGRGTTIYCQINRDRDGNVIDATVFSRKDLSSVQTWFNAGDEADRVALRQRFFDPSLNVIYVNE